MKKLLLLGFCALTSISVFSQKTAVAITSFEASSNSISINRIRAIEDNVKEAFYSTNRFDIVDRTSYDKLKNEKELQKSEDFIDGKTVAQTNLEGAEHIVTGRISQVDIKKEVLETSYYYSCKISFSLQVIDVATGKVVANKLIKPKQSIMGNVWSTSSGGADTPDKAFFNSLKGTQKEIDEFVAEYFPVSTMILEISEATSNEAKMLLLNTGSLNGSKKKQEFDVMELVKMKAGNKEIIRKKKLGEIRITEVEGEEISIAKVVKGGEAILAKFNAGANIECYSTK